MKTAVMMRIFLLASLLAILSMPAHSQNFDADINILFGMPQTDFRESLDRNALGLNGSIALRIPRLPLHAGLELGIMTYGRERRREQLSPTIPEIQLEVRTDYDIFTSHLFLRFEPEIHGIRPYLDGLVGIKYYLRNRVSAMTTVLEKISPAPPITMTALSVMEQEAASRLKFMTAAGIPI